MAGPNSLTSTSASNQARQRQSRRDEAIRKKAELDINKKMDKTRSRGGPPGSSNSDLPTTPNSSDRRNRAQNIRLRQKYAPGTVAALRPATALTIREDINIVEASQLMAAKRADSVLVVDEDERLSGIFTAKDVAYRVVAEGLNARSTLVRDIATANPLCVTTDTQATDALNTMVARGFRHLPVCNDEGDVVGLLDVIKCMYDALDKMDRAYQSSKALYDALEGVEKEWSMNPVQLVSFVDTFRDKMSCPNISTVLDGAAPVMVSPRTSVREVASLMRAHRTTASLVMESSGDRIAGIFTSKDLVLRVVAAGLDPSTCSVVRVMTPHPDTVSPDISIIDALKRMYERHYLNLPVLSADNEILGVVDVLRLCYATLEQMKTIQRNKQAEDGQGANGNSSELGESGPMWSRFFNGTLPAEFENRSEVGRNSHAGYSVGPPGSYLESSPFSPEIYPNESASMVEDIRSAVNSRVGEQETFPLAMSPMQAVAQGGLGAMSMPLPPTDSHIGCHSHSATAAQSQITVGGPSAPPPNVPEGHYTFKFKSPAGKTHRFTSPKDDIDDLRNAVVRLMTQDGVEDAQEMLDKVGIAYLDEDDDTVSLSTSKDLEHAVQVASQLGKHRVFIQFNPQGLAEHQAKKRLAREEELKKKREDDEAEMARKAVIAAKEALRGISVRKADEEATGPLGIPEKYLVPTALGGGFLAALLVVFIATKVAKS